MRKAFLSIITLISLSLAGCDMNSTNTSTSDLSTLVPSGEFPCDYKVTAKNNRRFKVLQLSDTQIAYPNHLEGVFDLIDYEIQTSNPDLIMLVGDNVYGRYDTDGYILTQLCEKLESYNIPWAPIFGNHDNECPLGVDWQCNLFTSYEHCLFKQRSELSGNSNYSIGCFIGESLVHTIYMMDTKGCFIGEINGPIVPYGISDEQLEFITTTQTKAKAYAGKDVKGFVSVHVMPTIFNTACLEKYNANTGPGLAEGGFEIPGNPDGDFGKVLSPISRNYDGDGKVFDTYKINNIDGIFAGHNHLCNASVLYEGIRMTFGLKSGKTDEFDINMLGGTIISIRADDTFSVEHLYYQGK